VPGSNTDARAAVGAVNPMAHLSTRSSLDAGGALQR
jgi:hypothetical protein